MNKDYESGMRYDNIIIFNNLQNLEGILEFLKLLYADGDIIPNLNLSVKFEFDTIEK